MNTFPPPESADSEGLLAVGGDLNPERILTAYRQGIFPWFSEGQPILWWSPDPRMVLIPQKFRPSHSLRKLIPKHNYSIRYNTAFSEVIRHCADTPRHGQNGTWLTNEMQQAYQKLHQMGYAHSIETWVDGQLVGGLYGLAVGKVFYGESMFSLQANASKLAFAHLLNRLCLFDFRLLDCQVYTSHLASLGAELIPRQQFLELLRSLTTQTISCEDKVFPRF